jgi:hypothetical protein
LTGIPRIEIEPRAAGMNPMMALKSVDLPEPLTPYESGDRPLGTSKLALRSAVWPLR